MATTSNSKSNTLISGTSDSDSIYNGGSNVTIEAMAGNDTVYSYGDGMSINGGTGNNFIHLYADAYNATVLTDSGKDSIESAAKIASINTGSGNDSVFLYSNAENHTINAGADNDSIYTGGQTVSVNAGSGNDYIHIYSNATKNTIYAGAGNDTIKSYNENGVLYQHTPGDGNDSIWGFKTNDTLQIANDGKGVYSTQTSDNDIVVTVEDNRGKITLSGAATLDVVNIEGILANVISNSKSKTVINGTSGKDFIHNYTGGDSVTIIGRADNDSIWNYGKKVSINSGDGDDHLDNRGNNVTVNGGAGNDFFHNDPFNGGADSVKMDGGDGNDTLHNFGEDVTMLGGNGNDLISNFDKGYINGELKFEDKGKNSSIDGGAGSDSIDNRGSKVTITGGIGDDSIVNSGASVSIDGGEDNDTIDVRGEAKFVTAKGGTGDDSIAVSGSNITINGDEGNDILGLWKSASRVVANGGTGKDYFYNHGSNITINGGADADTVWNSSVASSAIVDLGDGNDSIYNSASNTTILGGVGDDSIINTRSNSSIKGSNFIDGGDGKDYISNQIYIGDYTTVNGGADNDTIENRGSWASISGGAGNDSILSTGSSMEVTINPGTGDDTITFENVRSQLIQYAPGDGNDIIYGFKSNSTLQIADGSGTYTPETIGTDIIITVGDGKISLMSAASLNSLNILGIPVNTTINTVSNTTITGSAYDDTITNSGSNVTINALKGNDCISLGSYSKNNTFVYAQGDGYDTISGFKENDTVSIVGSSNYTKDSIDNDVVISLKGGEIVLKDAASLTSSVKINGGKEKKIGGVKIENESTEYLLDGTDGRDTLSNYAGGATIQGGNGNDSIFNSTKADYKINNSFGYVTIDGGAGNDTIFSYDPNVSINGGANADLISLRSSNFSGITINAGTGNDTIYGNANNYGVLYQYKKGDGYDTIHNFGSNDTLSISGATYRSEIIGNNVVVFVEDSEWITLVDAADKDIYIYPPSGGKGKFITNSNDNTLFSGSSYADTIKNYGDNVTVSAGNGNDTIYNDKGDRTSINAGAGNDSIDGNNDYITVSAGTGKDTITGNHWRSKLAGDGDNDLISITTYWYNTLDGGAGDDTIIASGSAHSVNGGVGKDLISLSGDALTVAGGADDDTIYGNTATSHLYEYGKGDGNDIIYNYGSNDSITISGSTWTTSTSGDNVIVTIADSGNITLMGAKGKTINIYPNTTPTVESSGVTAQDVIKKFMGVLDTTSAAGKAAVDEAVSVASGGYFANIGAAIEQMTLDCTAATDGETFLREKCGIVLYTSANQNVDTGAITGYDAGGSATQKTAKNIVPEEGSLDSFTGNNFTTKSLKVYLSSFPKYATQNWLYPEIINYNNLFDEDDQKYIWQAFKTWWADGILDLIEESYGNNYGFGNHSSATTKTLYFGFVNKPAKNGQITLAITGAPYVYTATGTAATLAMAVNLSAYGSLEDNGNPDGQNNLGYSYLDRVLAHEMTHAVMMATVNYFSDLPQFVTEGLAELTHGADDDRYTSIKNLANNPNNLGLSLALEPGTGTIGEVDAYAGGYMFMRYLAKQSAEHYPTSNNGAAISGNYSVSYSSSGSSAISLKNSLLTVSKDFSDNILDLRNYASVTTVDATALVKGIEITGNKNANSIAAGNGNDSVFANVGDDTLSGGAGDDVICGEAGNDKLYGDAGDDTISSGTGTDTLTGGDGKDVFVHVAENDVIEDYKAGEDKIKLVEGSIVGSSVSGSNVILNIGMHGLITVKGGKDKKITIIDGYDNETSKVYGNDIPDDSLTFKVTESPVTLDASYANADASSMKTAVKVTGNALDNSILGGTGNDKLYGQNGDDTLWGGAGNDTLTGGDGADTFIYSGGKDVITDYVSGEDKISLGADISSTAFSGKDVVLTMDKNNILTIKGVRYKELTLIDASGKELVITPDIVYLTNNNKTPHVMGNDYDYVDASARTKNKGIKITGNTNDNTILGGAGKDSIYGTKGNDYIDGGGNHDKLYGGEGDDEINGGTANDLLDGGAGDDTLWGGVGNDTLTGGNGADTFIYSGGKDVITDYVSGKDKISLGADISSTAFSGKDVVLTIDKNNILTIKGVRYKELTLIDARSKELVTTPDIVYLTNNNKTPHVMGNDYDYVDASARTKNKGIKITGNANNNTILGGAGKDSIYGTKGNDYIDGGGNHDKLYGGEGDDEINGGTANDLLDGGDGDDTLWGGIGNDTLKGGAGADVFIYNSGEGKDVISDFDNDDMLQITGKFSASYNSSKKTIAFKVDSTSSAITLKNFTATTFDINGDTWKISGSKLVKK